MQLHILNNPKDAPLAADAEFLKQSLFNLLHEEASPQVVETVKLLASSDDSSAVIEKVLPELDEQQTHDLTLASARFCSISVSDCAKPSTGTNSAPASLAFSP